VTNLSPIPKDDNLVNERTLRRPTINKPSQHHTFEIPIRDYPRDRPVYSSTNEIYNENGKRANAARCVSLRPWTMLVECDNLHCRYPMLRYILQMLQMLGLLDTQCLLKRIALIIV
jgi:hypothetical protein